MNWCFPSRVLCGKVPSTLAYWPCFFCSPVAQWPTKGNEKLDGIAQCPHLNLRADEFLLINNGEDFHFAQFHISRICEDHSGSYRLPKARGNENGPLKKRPIDFSRDLGSLTLRR